MLVPERCLITVGLRSRKTQGTRRMVLDGGHLSLGLVERSIEGCGIARGTGHCRSFCPSEKACRADAILALGRSDNQYWSNTGWFPIKTLAALDLRVYSGTVGGGSSICFSRHGRRMRPPGPVEGAVPSWGEMARQGKRFSRNASQGRRSLSGSQRQQVIRSSQRGEAKIRTVTGNLGLGVNSEVATQPLAGSDLSWQIELGQLSPSSRPRRGCGKGGVRCDEIRAGVWVF